MSPFPVIAVTTYGRDSRRRFHLPAAYVDAVRRAGGIPILLPPGEGRIGELAERFDGYILAGGGDLDPQTYGGEPHPSIAEVDPERDEFELELARQLLQRERPILAICRGMQVLNVACGGDLIVDLPSVRPGPVRHRGDNGEWLVHEVNVAEDSRLHMILGSRRMPVASQHHQAVREPAPEWRAVAFADDGVVEAMEHPQRPQAVAVQWHPELTLERPEHLRLFSAWVEGCRRPVSVRPEWRGEGGHEIG